MNCAYLQAEEAEDADPLWGTVSCVCTGQALVSPQPWTEQEGTTEEQGSHACLDSMKSGFSQSAGQI